jgi:predicted MFS family arabinose efflux permease
MILLHRGRSKGAVMSEGVEAFVGTTYEEEAYPTPSVAWYAVFVLAFMYWVSILDRFIITLLVDPIKRDLGISDVQFGMLHGLAFAVTFSLFGLLLGSLADRVNRRWLIFGCVTVLRDLSAMPRAAALSMHSIGAVCATRSSAGMRVV